MRLIAFLIVAVALVASVMASTPLNTYNVDTSKITVSGVSSGGFMAVQMHVAFSTVFTTGAGIIAGGPYYCAKDHETTATTTCMYVPEEISVSTLVDDTNKFYSNGYIDNPKNLADSKVYLFSGMYDTMVFSGVVDKLYDYYSNWVSEDNITYINDIKAEHAWITNDWGNNCALLMSPYINNCDYDASGAIFNWLYDDMVSRGTMNSANRLTFTQELYTGGSTPSSISMGDTGYVYVPTNCSQGGLCKLHVAFHGCSQTIPDIGTDFIDHTGLNDWAESNNIIVLFPQVIKSTRSPSNPEGCFDWWGYTNSKYAYQTGPQMVAVINMVNQLAGISQ